VESYQRDSAKLAKTLPYYQFKRDFTTVNEYYWGASSALHAVASRVRHIAPSEDFHSTLGLTQSAYATTLGHTSEQYAARLSVSRRWHRLLTLVIMSSAFERYLTAVATLAIASDPALSPGFPKKVDGLIFTKYGLQAGDRPTEPLTKGEWSSRLAAFRRYFGSVPLDLQASEAELEAMRKRRNQVTHAFGLDISPMSAHNAVLFGARRPDFVNKVAVSEGTLKKWLGVLETSAAAIDDHLLRHFIGGYELAAIYIEWNRDRNALYKASGIPRYSKGSDARKLGKFLGNLLDHPITLELAQSIMGYVDKL
jgi:hypothetical protein